MSGSCSRLVLSGMWRGGVTLQILVLGQILDVVAIALCNMRTLVVVGVAGIPRFLAARLSLPSFFHFAFVGRRRLAHAFVVVFFVLGVLSKNVSVNLGLAGLAVMGAPKTHPTMIKWRRFR